MTMAMAPPPLCQSNFLQDAAIHLVSESVFQLEIFLKESPRVKITEHYFKQVFNLSLFQSCVYHTISMGFTGASYCLACGNTGIIYLECLLIYDYHILALRGLQKHKP